MTEVYLLRHCEAYGNIYRRLDGVRNTDITDNGAIQIDCVAGRFQGKHIDAVFSSNLIRAQKTASGIAKAAGAPLFCREDLHERDMGIFDGKSWHEVAFVYKDIFSEWLQNFNSFVIPGGESYNDAGIRFRREIMKICTEFPDKTIVIVGHSMVMKALLEGVSQGPVQFGNNTAVSLLSVNTDRDIIDIRYLNDDSHLPEEMKQSRQRWTKRGFKLQDYSLRYNYPPPNGTNTPVMESADGIITIEGFEGDKKVGYLLFSVDGDMSEIKEITVFPEFRRNGFATQLIGEAMYSSSKRRCKYLVYTNKDNNDIIRRLAAKNGFQYQRNSFVRDIAIENYSAQK